MTAALLDLVLPRRCVGCAAAGPPLCAGCTGRGALLHPPVRAGVPVVAAVVYGDAVRAALIAYKERGRRELAGPLAALLVRAVRAVPVGDDTGVLRVVLVPVPSSAAAVRERGGDPLAVLTRRAGRACGLRTAGSALRPARRVLDSAGLGSAERAANLDHAFEAGSAPPHTAALVVDDIVTTGATVREAVRALQSAGWPVLGAAVVAATPLHPHDVGRVRAHPLWGHSEPV